jgi:hypothetical protein
MFGIVFSDKWRCTNDSALARSAGFEVVQISKQADISRFKVALFDISHADVFVSNLHSHWTFVFPQKKHRKSRACPCFG